MRRVRLPPRVADTALALALAAPTVFGLLADEAHVQRPWWFVGPVAALTTLPLAFRRTRPLAVFAITVGALVVLLLADVDTYSPGVAVAAYTLAAYCDRAFALKAGVTGVLALFPASIYASGEGVFGVAGPVVVTGAAWILGDNIRTRRAYLRELEDKAARLEREREESERRAAADEQARIARELHDVIAHGVSVMVLQAAGARQVLDADPARAGEALRAIEESGREALDELRRLFDVGGEGTAALAPQPGLPQLAALVDQVRAAGLAVKLDVDGKPDGIPAGVELSAYRVVQEALTNTLKHAFAKQAWVFVRRRDGQLEVEVLDDGAGPPHRASTRGHGLVGMRQRVGLFGGELHTGAREDGGFCVRARFPLGGGGG